MYSQEELWDIQKARKAAIFSNFVESDIIKGKSFPIGTVHNGFKKVSEGVWKKVSSEGKTKEEHNKEADENFNSGRAEFKRTGKGDNSKKDRYYAEVDKHLKHADKLDDKEYSDSDVHGKEEKKEDNKGVQLNYKDILGKIKAVYGYDEGDDKTLHKDDIIHVINSDKDGKNPLQHVSGYSEEKVKNILKENGWKITDK